MKNNSFSIEEHGILRHIALNVIKGLEASDAFKDAPKSEIKMAKIVKMQNQLIELFFDMLDDLAIDILTDEDRTEHDLNFANVILDTLIETMSSMAILYLGSGASREIILNMENMTKDDLRNWKPDDED